MLPQDWSWELNAHGFYTNYKTWFGVAAIAYLPTIFFLERLMRHRKAFDLGGGSGSGTGRANTIMWWEAFLALFSLFGASQVVPLCLEPLFAGSTVAVALCGTKMNDDPRAFWGFLFSLSKVFELADTLFVVLRKKDLILLQYWHHFATMVYCWYGSVVTYQYNHTNLYFAAINLSVHTVMYSWYAASRTGWKSPRWIRMAITLLQLCQMVVGIAITAIAVTPDEASGCGRWLQKDPAGVAAACCMYGSFLVLFTKLFYSNYCRAKPQRGTLEASFKEKIINEKIC